MEVVLGIIIALLVVGFLVYFFYVRGENAKKGEVLAPSAPTTELVEIDKSKLETIIKIAETHAAEIEQKKAAVALRASDLKEKRENFKMTREQLREDLRGKLDAKTWGALADVLRSADKGGVGIYVLYNETKDKYYIGQAKRINDRIKQHFAIEPIAMHHLEGDVIKVKTLYANEVDVQKYNLDHIEKLGIEIFESATSGYNKTSGNL
jgi:hypothetical protein